MLHENDISPFEITQSGLVASLLTYLTKESILVDFHIFSLREPDLMICSLQDTLEGHEEIKREVRIRTFLHVFLGCPRSLDSEELPDAEAVAKFQMFVQKMNACVTHLEQFPIKMHADMTGGSSGGPYSGGPARSAGSTLRFFKTHHLKCR